jgi:hypothetical protein
MIMMDLGKTYFTSRDNEFPKQIRELTNIEAQEIKDANSVLHKFDYFKRRLTEIELNRDDYFRTIERYEQIFKKDNTGEPANYDYKRLAFIDVNRAFINTVSSFKSFIEHILTYLKDLYGDQSAEFLKIDKLTNSFYDGYLSYRLLIRLRDFGIHVNYPIQSVHFDRVHDGKGGYNYRVKAQFNKSVFMESKTLKQKLGSDLDLYGELFDVEPFINELMQLLERFFKAFIKVDEQSFLPSAELVKNLSQEAKTDNIGITVLQMDGPYLKHDTKIIQVGMSQEFYKSIE